MQDPLKLLVVDDDALTRHALRQALLQSDPHAAIHEAATCSEAIQAILSEPFDCVLLDDSLSDGDGIDCLLDVQKVGITTPVVLLTGPDQTRAGETLTAGAIISLPKGDLTAQVLDHSLRSALRFHQAQEQLKRAHEALELRDRAIAAASNGIVIADPRQPGCPIIYCNPAFTAITGFPPEEVIGRNCRFLQGLDTDGQTVQHMRDCLREERDCLVVLRNYKKDGTPFWNELSLSPVRDVSGKLTQFIGVQTDITERRNAEEAVRQNAARQQTLLRDMFFSVTEGKLSLCASDDDLPPPLTQFADPVSLSASGGIRELRQMTVSASLAAGHPVARREDLEGAVGEAAMNAVVHAASGLGAVFTHERGTVQVRVTDGGKGIAISDLPNATLRRGYSTAGTMGHGFKMILKTVDRVHLLTGGAGTTVVMEQDQAAPSPIW